MTMIINDRALKISNPVFDKAGCFAIANKITLTKDSDTAGNIKANSLVLSDLYHIKQSQTKHTIDVDSLFSEIKSKGFVSFPKYSNTQIISLFGKPMVVTIIRNNELYELICDRVVQLQGDILKLYLNNSGNPVSEVSYRLLNKSTLEKMCIKERMEDVPKKHYWDSVTHLCYYVQFSIKEVYSIETLGETIVESKDFTEFGEKSWTPNDIEFTSITLVIDYDKKIISGSYSDDFEVGGGRRTSNGWEDKYISQYSYYYKSFDLISSMNAYLNEICTRFSELGSEVKINNFNIDVERLSLINHIVINFTKPFPFREINEVLKFNVSGSTYFYYL